jgi:transposase
MRKTDVTPIVDLFQKIIGLKSPWYIKNTEFNHSQKQIDIHIDFKRGAKFSSKESGKKVYPVYSTKIKTWRHLNIAEYACYLHCRVPQISIGEGKTQVIIPPFAGKSNGFTLKFEALLLHLIKGMVVSQAGSVMNERGRKLWDLLDRYIKAGRELSDFAQVRYIGTDETAKSRGHNYITIFIDLEKSTVIFITDGKDSETIKKFVEDFTKHNGKVENVIRVSIDMSPAFIKGVAAYLPSAEITFDRFHVTKIVNEAVDKVRRSEIKLFPILKNARYAVLKNAKNLTETQQEKLAELHLSKLNLKTLRAMHIRENFQAIYTAETKEDFEILLKKWYYWATHSRLPEMIEAARTIRQHWSGILSWYDSRLSTGTLEGVNSVAQAAKAKARGYRTFKNFSNVIYLLKGNLNFSAVNKHYLYEMA